ncbi:hypothetical protein DFH94DRAFT_742027 [Russula ochroleuca]|jgi:hypothetical protein|uniref:Uncharacterized protein n=1 Tax=Russula ochroleuca TaxID=152965 RepID=A0A9P5MWG0_9AGAM|nr:hypothetical protein DFH94DRAFT_742027 [Russula ochroleuca]
MARTSCKCTLVGRTILLLCLALSSRQPQLRSVYEGTVPILFINDPIQIHPISTPSVACIDYALTPVQHNVYNVVENLGRITPT